MLRRALRLFVLSCSLLVAPALAAAQEPEKSAAEDRAQSFQAVSGAVQEDVPGGPLLVFAYGFVLVALIGYVFRLGRLHGRVDADLRRLERALAAAAPKSDGRE